METNETGKFFVWPASWLQSAQWPIRWQDWRSATDGAPVDRSAVSPVVEEGTLPEEVEPVELAKVTEDLAQLIAPVLPDPHFRAELKVTLLAAHAEQGMRRPFFPSLADYPLRSWQVIATVPVVVGVVALIWRYAQRSAGQSLEAA